LNWVQITRALHYCMLRTIIPEEYYLFRYQ